MRISDEQKAILEGFTCERLSSDPDNLRLVDDFFNRRNPSLVQTLQNEAFEEDQDGKIAYYIIKDKDTHVLFFFSLKSGSLYDTHLDANVIKLFKTLNAYIQDSLSDPDLSDQQRLELNRFQEKIRSQKGVTRLDLDNLPKKKAELLADLEKELSKDVTHVGKTFSSLELVHFCANNEYDDLWEGVSLPHSIGVIVFWYFIVGIVLEVRKLMGIQYLFLFAADLSENDSLIGYYRDRLEFIRDEERATVKPIYDLSCEFMYQECMDIEERRKLFFENFNMDKEES